MNKSLILYILALALASLAVWRPVLSWLLPVALLGVLPAGAVWLWHQDGRRFSALGFRQWSAKKKEFVKGILVGLVVPQLMTSLLFATGMVAFATDTWPVPLVVGIAGGLLVGAVKSSISVFIEEIVFRGFFIQYLGTGNMRTILLSSFLFGMAHIPSMIKSGLEWQYWLLGIASFFTLGMALGLSFVRTESSLMLPLGLHFGYNLGYSFLTFIVATIVRKPIAINYIGPVWLVGQSPWAPESGLAGILVALVIIGCVMTLVTKQMIKTSTTA